MSFDIRQFQIDHEKWVLHNFPDQLTHANRHQSFLGVVEEIGELAHTILKFEQRIRDGLSEGNLTVKLEDGIGDLVIFLAGVCDQYDLDLETCISETWARVSKRDWVADPVAGGERPPEDFMDQDELA